MLESPASHALPQNSYLTQIHTRHTEEQLLDVQIYSEAVSICTLYLKVFTVPWCCWRAFRHGLSTTSSKLSSCHTSPLRCRRAVSASLWRGWKAFLAAVCVWGTSCHSRGLICQWCIILKGKKAMKNILLGGLLFLPPITYVAASSQSFITVDPFAPQPVLVITCHPAAGTQQPCWTFPSAWGWASRGNKQVISVESKYICPKHVMVLWWRSLKADIIYW